MTTIFDSQYIRLRVWHVDGSIERYEPELFKSNVWFDSRVGRVRIGTNIRLSSDDPARFILEVGCHLSLNAVSCKYFSHARASDSSDVFIILATDAQYLISSLVGDADFDVSLDEDERILSFNPEQGVFPEDTPPPFPRLTFDLVEDDGDTI